MPGYQVLNTKEMLQGDKNFAIIGDDDEVLHVTLKPNQTCWAEPGTMIHCDHEIKSFVDAGNSCFDGIMRVCFQGASLFRVHWKNNDEKSDHTVGFAAHFPAKVVPIKLEDWQGQIYVKEHAFLAAMDPELQFNIERAPSLGAGAMGGQGAILNKIGGKGWVFLSATGAVFSKTLEAGESIAVEPTSVVAWESTVQFSWRWAGGVGMICCGGEGLTETLLTGPGRVVVQSMPFEKLKKLFKRPAKKVQKK